MKIPPYFHRQLPARPGMPQAPIMNIKPSQIGEAQALRQFGRRMTGALTNVTAFFVEKYAKAYQSNQYSDAITRASSQMNEFMGSLKTDADWQTYNERFNETQKEVFENVNNQIQHFGARRQFNQWFQARKVDWQGDIRDMATDRMLNQAVADFSVNIDKAVELRDPQLVIGLIQHAEESGIIQPVAAVKYEKDALHRIAYGKVQDKAWEILQSGDPEAEEKAEKFINENAETSIFARDQEGNVVEKKIELTIEDRKRIINYVRSEKDYQERRRQKQIDQYVEKTNKELERLQNDGLLTIKEIYSRNLPWTWENYWIEQHKGDAAAAKKAEEAEEAERKKAELSRQEIVDAWTGKIDDLMTSYRKGEVGYDDAMDTLDDWKLNGAAGMPGKLLGSVVYSKRDDFERAKVDIVVGLGRERLQKYFKEWEKEAEDDPEQIALINQKKRIFLQDFEDQINEGTLEHSEEGIGRYIENQVKILEEYRKEQKPWLKAWRSVKDWLGSPIFGPTERGMTAQRRRAETILELEQPKERENRKRAQQRFSAWKNENPEETKNIEGNWIFRIGDTWYAQLYGKWYMANPETKGWIEYRKSR